MKKYSVVFNTKVPINGPGEITEHRLVRHKKTIRADSFADARDKIRKKYAYNVVDIDVTEGVNKSWVTRLITKLLKS